MPVKVLLAIAILVWMLLAMIRVFRVRSNALSSFELERRSKGHDTAAITQQERERHLPNVRAIRFILEMLLMALFVALLVLAYGFWTGIFWTLVGLLALPAMGRLHAVSGGAEQWYQRHEPKILELAAKWNTPLRFFQEQDEVVSLKVHSKEELIHIAQQSDKILSLDEELLLQHTLHFNALTVADVMTPSSVIEAVEASETVGPVLLDRLHKTGHSRFPVMEGDVDHMVGMLYLHDLVSLSRSVKRAREAMQPKVFYIRQDATLNHALHAFLKTHHHLFVVVNEYRETVGILSLEDVVEALLGKKIVDEFDLFSDLRAVAERNPRKINQPAKHQDV